MAEPPQVVMDREEITVVLIIDDVAEGESEVATAEARAGRAGAFREDSREARMAIAREAEHRYQRKVSWGCASATTRSCGPTSRLR